MSSFPKQKDPIKFSTAKSFKIFGDRWLCDFSHIIHKGFKEMNNTVMTKLVAELFKETRFLKACI